MLSLICHESQVLPGFLCSVVLSWQPTVVSLTGGGHAVAGRASCCLWAPYLQCPTSQIGKTRPWGSVLWLWKITHTEWWEQWPGRRRWAPPESHGPHPGRSRAGTQQSCLKESRQLSSTWRDPSSHPTSPQCQRLPTPSQCGHRFRPESVIPVKQTRTQPGPFSKVSQFPMSSEPCCCVLM